MTEPFIFCQHVEKTFMSVVYCDYELTGFCHNREGCRDEEGSVNWSVCFG